METRQEHWGGLAAGFFFLSSMGAMMMIFITLLDFAGGMDLALLKIHGAGGWMALFACILMGCGGLMLFAELGNKVKAYHLHKPCIMLLGAACMAICAVCAILYASFYVTVFPWSDWVVLRRIIATVGLIAGIVLVLYPGPEMAEAPGRPFWRKGGLMALFFFASVPLGLAGILIIGAFSVEASMFSAMPIATLFSLLEMSGLWVLFGISLVVEAIAIFAYLASAKGHGAAAAYSVNNIMKGDFKVAFWLGVVVVGIVIPLVLVVATLLGFFFPGFVLIGSLCAIIGGGFLRTIILFAGVRVVLPGEEQEYVSQAEVTELAEALTQRWDEKAKWLAGR